MNDSITTDLLRNIYLARYDKNKSYSISAFARDLGVTQPYISMIFSGKRKPNLALTLQICEILEIEDSKRRELICSIFNISKEGGRESQIDQIREENLEFYKIESESFRILARWYHIPILELIGIDGFQNDFRWISRKLGITAVEAQAGIRRLVRLGLVETKDGHFVRTKKVFYVPTITSRPAIREFHRSMIEKGKLALDKVDQRSFGKREISSITIKTSPKKIKQAKEKIKKFKRELISFLQEDNYSELYQMNIQFFSLLESDQGN